MIAMNKRRAGDEQLEARQHIRGKRIRLPGCAIIVGQDDALTQRYCEREGIKGKIVEDKRLLRTRRFPQ